MKELLHMGKSEKQTIAYITASNTTTANRRIEECIEYARGTLPGGWRDELIGQLQHALTQYPAGEIVDDTGNAITVAVNRLDNPDRTGKPALQFVGDRLIDLDIKHLILPCAGTMSSDHISDAVRHGATVHCVQERLVLQPTGDMPEHVRHAVRTLCSENRDPGTLVDGIPHRGGRPPMGCKVEDGMLRADDDFEKVRRMLLQVQRDEITKTNAANRLRCTRKTIDNALERTELYQLD